MLALRLNRGDGATTRDGQVVRLGAWPRDTVDQMLRTGAAEYCSVAPDGSVAPASYRATRTLKDGPTCYERGQVVPGVREWPAFLSLFNLRYIEPVDAVVQQAPSRAHDQPRGRRR